MGLRHALTLMNAPWVPTHAMMVVMKMQHATTLKAALHVHVLMDLMGQVPKVVAPLMNAPLELTHVMMEGT